MSILAKLLKKNEPTQAKGDIPPGVVQAVSSSAGKGAAERGAERRKFLLLGGLAAVLVAGGALLVLYLKLNTPVRPMPRSETTAVPVPPAPVVQRQVSSAPPAPALEVVPHQEKVRLTTYATTVKRSAPAAPAPRPAAPAAEPQAEKKAVPRDQTTAGAYLFAARNAEVRGDYLQALRSYQKALEADPGNYRIMNNVASAMLHLGMYREALVMVQQILAIKPEYVSAMVNGGIAQYRLGLLSEARQWFERATAIDPSHREALYNLALSQEKAGSLDSALESYRRLSGGGDPRGTLGMARILEWRQEKVEALRLYRDILVLPDAGNQIREAARERIRVLDR
ncbi:tetratricopeptide repeat protein [Trichlorobacter ammonificans]|uniref:TPR repeat-containing protein n=1 Tax=Trichlorobacter ammonificans TaxID=2916410 RepID=A0ABM9DAY7_9BACT|nr:tetratricopeptide repeat protein [Trichlorobacter ammonificans]CAH2032366.1 TPR repeat-containing protein [Trichlorobacter ammonificans]